MNRLLHSIGLRGSILTLLALPLFVLTAFCSWTAWNSWRTAAEMHQMSALTGVAPSISSLVHELQKERGSSAGFIGSQGRKNELRQRLASQRPQTDQSLRGFEQAFEMFQASAYGDVFSSKLRQAQTSLARLEQERVAVDELRHSTPEMARYYTGTITDLLGLIETMPTLSTNAEVATALSGYLSLLHAKERAGRERAMGAAGFGAGKFSSKLHSRLVSLIGQQEAYIAAFNLNASEDQKAYYQQQLSGSAISEVNRLRKIAIESPFTADLQNVSGGTWFDVSTKRIDLLKNVEDKLAGDLTALVDQLQSEAKGTFFSLASGLLVLMVALGGLGFMIVASITRPISEIVNAVEQYQPGDHLTMPATDRSDELGQLARSLNIIGETGLEAARLRAALDSCQTGMIVTDPTLNVIYLNSNIQHTLRAAEVDIRRDLPHFSADQLLGANIEVFYKDHEQRGVLANLHTSHKTNIEIGGRKITLIVSPVLSASGERLGAVVEWDDRTAELTAMEEIDGVVAAANRGDLSQRLQLEGKEGFMLGLAKGINQLTSLIDEVIGNVGSILEGLAQGDLSQKISAEYEGKFGDLKNNANDTIDQLIGIVSNIQSASEEVKNAAAEITSGTSDLSDRTEQAATNLEETAASTEQMSATVKQNAANAGSASKLAIEADKSAKSGGEVVEQAVTAMAQIEQSAQKITDIIGVIDEIAFQTNLLALNASVEAARAGEAGKGFAVVAQEVRQLAQRSAQAASDIKDLIQSSNGQVQDGVLLVNQAGTALEKIVESIGKVASIVNGISSASQEQAAGVQEINSSITSMDEMTQQNSALVEESTAAARSMSNQAERLAEEMAFFRLGANQPSKSGSPKAARPARQPSRQPISVNKAEPALVNDDWSEF